MKRTSSFRDARGAPMITVASFSGILVIASLSGCNDRRIETYEIAKEFAPVAGAASRAGHADEGAPAPAAERSEPLIWSAPSHWKTKPASAMRRASFGVPLVDGTEADLSISVLAGAAGGLPANVNRWRTQLGLPELGADEIARAAETIPAGGITFTLFDLAGKPNGAEVRMLSAVAEFEGQSWFFKLTGHDHCVGVEKPAFVTFLRSVKTR